MMTVLELFLDYMEKVYMFASYQTSLSLPLEQHLTARSPMLQLLRSHLQTENFEE